MKRAATRIILAAAAAALLLTAAIPAAFAQAAIQVRIRQADLQPSGETRVVVSVSGEGVMRSLTAKDFTLTESGAKVGQLDVKPLLESAAQTVSVALLMDISGSTAGAPIESAKQAAKSFLGTVLAKGVRVAVVAFGPGAETRSGFTTDPQALTQTIDSLQPSGETALYDAVVLGTSLLKEEGGLHNLVLFSDGKDTVSRSSLDQAIASAKEVQAPILAVGLVTPDTDQPALDRLAGESGGRGLSAAAADQLSQAFGLAAQEIASQYVLTYTSTKDSPKELDLAVGVNVDGATAKDAVVVLNPRTAPTVLADVEAPSVGLLGTKFGLFVGMVSFFVAALLILFLAVGRTSEGKAARVLRRGLSAYGRGARAETDSMASAISKRAADIVGQVPKPTGFEERLQLRLDRAGWPFRANEFLALRVAVALGGLIVGIALFSSWLVAILFAVIAGLVPRFVLTQRIQRRQSAFLAQLPDTLQLLSASLQAGYGLMQAIDTVTKESSPPTSTEFARALSEARLGMPIDEALQGMAERMGSEDFRWVVMAINIQREVGGNLAALLSTVADTLREREQLRRQVRVLSAEGRLSAWILTLLPFVIIGYLALVNRPYLALLFTRGVGRAMMIGALFFIVIGVFWMRRMIRIEV